MLTKADDYPVHQTAEPIAHAGTDRNFYDRYFFNGYSADGSVFFATALGVYPHLNIMDASFCVIHEGVQHNLRASKILYGERMDTKVGPIGVDVVEPLHILSVTVDDNDHGIRASLWGQQVAVQRSAMQNLEALHTLDAPGSEGRDSSSGPYL